MKRLAILCLAALAAASTISPASARRVRRSHRVMHRAVHRPASRLVRAAPAAPAVPPVRSVVLFVANNYSGTEWARARDARKGLMALDRLPDTALAPAPDDRVQTAEWAHILGAGQPSSDPTVPTFAEAARQQGKTIGVVTGGSVNDWAVRGVLLSDARGEEEAQQRLLEMAPVVLTRTPTPALDNGVTALPADPQRILTAEAMPLQAAAPAAAMPFDTLVFRALHLLSRNARGFVLLVEGDPNTVDPVEFDAAVSTATGFAQRDGHTVVLVERWTDRNPILIQSGGPLASKFTGTLDAADVPKIIAGVIGVRPFRRDFSPLFANRAQSAPQRTALRSRGGLSLPW